MKKLFTLLLLSLSFLSSAQEKTDCPEEGYRPFLDTNKMWIEQEYHSDYDFAQNETVKLYYLKLDQINDTVYRLKSKLFSRKFWTGIDYNNPEWPYTTTYFTDDWVMQNYFYEDTVNRKVYFSNTEDLTYATLLFDFR